MRTSVNVRLNFGRKGGQEACCLIDESCLKQGLGRSNDGLELSYLGKESGEHGFRLTRVRTYSFTQLITSLDINSASETFTNKGL
jgi:hypothetical protein